MQGQTTDEAPTQTLDAERLTLMYALSAPGTLEETLSKAGMSLRSDQTIEATMVFPDTGAAVAAFLSAGATALAIRHTGQHAVEQALHEALAPFTKDGQVTLPGWFRVVQTG